MTAIKLLFALLYLMTASAAYNYTDVLRKSIKFYAAQRSGRLLIPNHIPWRADSGLNHVGDKGEDLTGGWLDAGDNVKFNFPMAASTTLLLWSIIEYKDAYKGSGLYQSVLESVKWPLDYLVKCHVSDNVLYAQCGDGNLDHSNWERPENITYAQPCFKISPQNPGSDLAGEVAAAFAAGYIAFKDFNPTFAADLLLRAHTILQTLIAESTPILFKTLRDFTTLTATKTSWYGPRPGLRGPPKILSILPRPRSSIKV